LFHDNAAGHQTVFIIQARNTKGQNRQSGADDFEVKFVLPEKIEEPVVKKNDKPHDNEE
jgi:hypothetical protein